MLCAHKPAFRGYLLSRPSTAITPTGRRGSRHLFSKNLNWYCHAIQKMLGPTGDRSMRAKVCLEICTFPALQAHVIAALLCVDLHPKESPPLSKSVRAQTRLRAPTRANDLVGAFTGAPCPPLGPISNRG